MSVLGLRSNVGGLEEFSSKQTGLTSSSQLFHISVIWTDSKTVKKKKHLFVELALRFVMLDWSLLWAEQTAFTQQISVNDQSVTF